MLLSLPPTKEKIIAQAICAKVMSLRASKTGGDNAAKKAIEEIISRIKTETKDEKLVNAIEEELKKCHIEIMA